MKQKKVTPNDKDEVALIADLETVWQARNRI